MVNAAGSVAVIAPGAGAAVRRRWCRWPPKWWHRQPGRRRPTPAGRLALAQLEREVLRLRAVDAGDLQETGGLRGDGGRHGQLAQLALLDGLSGRLELRVRVTVRARNQLTPKSRVAEQVYVVVADSALAVVAYTDQRGRGDRGADPGDRGACGDKTKIHVKCSLPSNSARYPAVAETRGHTNPPLPHPPQNPPILGRSSGSGATACRSLGHGTVRRCPWQDRTRST